MLPHDHLPCRDASTEQEDEYLVKTHPPGYRVHLNTHAASLLPIPGIPENLFLFYYLSKLYKVSMVQTNGQRS